MAWANRRAGKPDSSSSQTQGQRRRSGPVCETIVLPEDDTDTRIIARQPIPHHTDVKTAAGLPQPASRKKMPSIEERLTSLSSTRDCKCLGKEIADIYWDIEAVDDRNRRDKLTSELTKIANKILEKNLVELLRNNSLSNHTLFLLQNGLTTISRLARYLYIIRQDADIFKSTNVTENSPWYQIVYRLGQQLECLGVLAYNDVDVSVNWVQRLVKGCPTIKQLHCLTYTKLKEYLEGVSLADVAVVENIYTGANKIRTEVKMHGMDLVIAEKLEKSRVTSAREITQAIYIETLKTISPDQALRFKSMYANQLERNKQEERCNRASLYQNKLTEALAIVKHVREDPTLFTKESQAVLKTKLDQVSSILQLTTKWKIPEFGQLSSLIKGIEYDVQVALRHVKSKLETKTNESIVAAASQGLALSGFIVARNMLDNVAKRPTQSLLKKPEFVEHLKLADSPESFFFLSTKPNISELFVRSVKSSGLSMSKSAFECGYEGYSASSEATIAQRDMSSATGIQRKGKYASAVKVTLYPTKAFRFHPDSIQLTDEAKIRARWLEDSEAGRLFFQDFGSHICMGKHQMGGAIFETIILNTQEEVDESLLLRAVVKQFRTEKQYGFSVLGTEKSVSLTVEQQPSGQKVVKGLCKIQTCTLGPSVSDADILRTVLEYDSSTWAIIDRDNQGLLVPVWDLLFKLGQEYRKPALIIKHAWESQAVFNPSHDKIKSLSADASSVNQTAHSVELKKEVEELKKFIQREVTIYKNEKPDLVLVGLANIFTRIISTQTSVGSEFNSLAEALQVSELTIFLKDIVNKPPDIFTAAHAFLRAIFSKETRETLPSLDPRLESFLKLQNTQSKGTISHQYDDILPIVDRLRRFSDRMDAGEIDEQSCSLEVAHTLGTLHQGDIDAEMQFAVDEATTRYGFVDHNNKLLHPLTAAELRALAGIIERILQARFMPGDQVRYLYTPTSSETTLDQNVCLAEGLGTVTSVSGYSAYIAWTIPPQHFSKCDSIYENISVPFCKLEKYDKINEKEMAKAPTGTGITWSDEKMVTTQKHKLNFNDFCKDRSPGLQSASPSEAIIDVLRHRTEVFRKPKQLAKSAPWSSRNTKACTPSNDNYFTSLLELLKNCNLSAKIELFRQLLDQRYTIPLIVPQSEPGMFLFQIEALRFVDVRLWNNSFKVVNDVKFPRVAFLSRTQTGLTENASMAQQVLHCDFTSAICKQEAGTTAEFGVGFIPKKESTELFEAWLVLYVRGNYKELASVINQFADFIVVELDRGDNPNLSTIPGVIVGRHQVVLTWKNTRKCLEYFEQKNLITICGNFHDVAGELQKGLSHYRSTRYAFPRSPLENINSPNLIVEDKITGLKDIDYFVTTLHFDEIRKSLVLQKSFARESCSRLVMQRVRTSQTEIEAIRSDIDAEIIFRRRVAASQIKLPILTKFVALLAEQDANLRVVGLIYFENVIIRCCDVMLKSEKQRLNRAWETYQLNTKDSDALTKYYDAKKEYTDKGISLEHLWRELSHIFTAQPETYSHFPRLAAQHLLDGFALEIMDGDAGSVNIQWFRAVMTALDEQIASELGRKAKVFTISAMGTQSTGKSTLLNTMFGCRLRTSAGQSTRGVNLQLVRATNRDLFDIVLVIDTEGIRSPEFYGTEGAVWRDNRIATFAILPADTCLITTVSEEDSAIKEVLPIVMLAFKGSNIAERTAGRLSSMTIFVYSRVDTSPQSLLKFQRNREQLRIDLKEAAMKIVGQKVAGDGTNEKTSTDNADDTLQNFLRHFQTSEDETESDVKYLGILNKGERPPSDAPNFLYGEKVIQVREYINSRLLKTGFQGHTLNNWVQYLQLVLHCIDTTDFEMNFKTAVEYQAYNELEAKINQARHLVAREYSAKYSKSESEILDAEVEPQIEDEINKLDIGVRNVVQDQSEEVANMLKERTYKHFEQTEASRWRYFLDDQRITWANLLKSVYDNKWKFTQLEERYEKSIMAELRKTWDTDSASLQDEQRASLLFEAIFQKYKRQAVEENPSLNVHEKITQEYENHPELNVLRIGNVNLENIDEFVQGFKEKENIKLISARLKGRINNLIRNLKRYDAAIVTQAINMTKDDISDNIVNKQAVNTIHAMVYRLLLDNFKEIQNDWDSKNNIAARLDVSKSRMKNKFLSICQGFVGTRLIARDLTDGLQQAVIEGYRNQLALDVKANIQSQLWVGRSDVMQAHLDWDLMSFIKGKDINGLLTAIADSEYHYQRVLHKLISECADQKGAWKGMMNNIMTAVRNASSLAQAYDSDRTQIFKLGLTRQLPNPIKLKLSNLIWRDILKEGTALSSANWKEVGAIVEKELKTWEIGLVPRVSIKELGTAVCELLEREGRTSVRQRCSAACPRCNMICIKYAGHETELSDVAKLHDCAHQPIGLTGGHWLKHPKYTDQLIPETCTILASTGGSFLYNDKWVKWSEFCQIYPTWTMPSIHQRQKLREYIFYHYQPALTRKYVTPVRQICSYTPAEYNYNFRHLEDECRAKIQGCD